MTDQMKGAEHTAFVSPTTTTRDVRTQELTTPASRTAHPSSAPDACLLELTPTHLDELSSALGKVRRQDIPLLRITREHFPLPALAADLHQLTDILDNGRGFAVIKGLPVQQYSAADLKTIFWGLGQHLGVPVSQDAGGHLVTAIHPSSEYRCRAGSLVHRSAPRLRFRSGGSDAVALLCTSGGGRRSVACSAAIYNTLLRDRPELIHRMYRRFYFDRRGEHSPDEVPYHSVPLACWFAGG